MTLGQIKAEIRKKDPNEDEDSEAFKAQVVLLASVVVGPGMKNLKKFTGYDGSLIEKFGHNLRKSGVFCGRRVYANWADEEEGGVAFILDTLVAMGLMERTYP